MRGFAAQAPDWRSSAPSLEGPRAVLRLEPRAAKVPAERGGVEAVAQAVELARHGTMSERRADADCLGTSQFFARQGALHLLVGAAHARALELGEEAMGV